MMLSMKAKEADALRLQLTLLTTDASYEGGIQDWIRKHDAILREYSKQMFEAAALRAQLTQAKLERDSAQDAYDCACKTEAAYKSKLTQANQQLAEMREALEAVAALINESKGVDGLHLNGDVATWEELRTGGRFEEWLLKFDAALSSTPTPRYVSVEHPVIVEMAEAIKGVMSEKKESDILCDDGYTFSYQRNGRVHRDLTSALAAFAQLKEGSNL